MQTVTDLCHGCGSSEPQRWYYYGYYGGFNKGKRVCQRCHGNDFEKHRCEGLGTVPMQIADPAVAVDRASEHLARFPAVGSHDYGFVGRARVAARENRNAKPELDPDNGPNGYEPKIACAGCEFCNSEFARRIKLARDSAKKRAAEAAHILGAAMWHYRSLWEPIVRRLGHESLLKAHKLRGYLSNYGEE